MGISCNFRPGAGFKSSLIFFVQPKSQVCLSCGLLWWLGILFPTALPQVLYWSCVPLSQIYSLSELHAPFNTDHLELLLLNDSAVLWGTKFTANRLLKQWVGLCLQCGSQVNSLVMTRPLPSHKIIFLKVHTFCSFSLLKSN